MSITLATDNDDIFELAQYIEHIEDNVDLDDRASVMASAPALRALANNRSFFVRKLNEDLASLSSFQSFNSYTAQTMLLGTGRGFHVRANIWLPCDERPQVRAWQEQLFVYGLPHDHNFDFLTVGYHGPGYSTDLYEYDRSSVLGMPGERVELVSRGKATLEPGKVMFYRACRDVHAQLPPAAFSISLNLMIESRKNALLDQYIFDPEQGVIRGTVQTGTSRSFLFELPRYLGDDTTRSTLERLAAEHPSGRVRAASLETLCALEPGEAERIWRRSLDSEHPFVRAVAGEKLRLAS
ncbi:transposase [Sorangium sp. So ce406]|uniref:transposase n=1 Tax=Sorangium sp. So ce406 TaxID=3133311 RepID=UPI003F5C189E